MEQRRREKNGLFVLLRREIEPLPLCGGVGVAQVAGGTNVAPGEAHHLAAVLLPQSERKIDISDMFSKKDIRW